MATHNKYPAVFEELVETFKSFPGVGRKSAERMAFSLIKWPPDKIKRAGETISSIPLKVTHCPECGNLWQDGTLCGICTDQSRDASIICVVEEASQIQNLEKSGLFKGRYHVLGGKYSPIQGKEAHHLNTESLLKRLESGEIREIIFALSFDVEGQATAAYLAHLLKDRNLKISRLATGLPVGSDISYADSATIAAALSGRTGMF